MSRLPHLLRPNRVTEIPHNAAWVDTETDPVRVSDTETAHVLRFGWSVFQRSPRPGRWTAPSWRRFESPGAFWSHLLRRARPRTRLYLFAHNWSFDAPVLHAFDELPRRGWTLSRAVVECPPVILIWRRARASLVMLDTLNWWRMPLARIGESLGLPKLPMPPAGASRAAWDRYARRDVEIIRRAMRSWWDFLRAYDLGGFAHTLAGQSLRAYRHRFMDHAVLIDASAGALSLARDALHGGRTEAFRLGRIEGPVHCLDVNSMYPAVMREHSYPTRLLLYVRAAALDELRRWCLSRCVVARVRLETDVPRYAHVHDGKLLFPVGTFTAALTTPELATALAAGQVRECFDAAVYERAPIFVSFVDALYRLRCEASARADSVSSWLLKILMNSLYGKFAQRGGGWTTLEHTDRRSVRSWVEIDADTGTRYSMREFGGIVQQRLPEGESHDSHPAIAAHVTAYARERLWALMLRAGRSDVIYCDTDSLYVSDAGLERLRGQLDPDCLGALKLEGSYPWLLVHGPKDYETPSARVCKGVRASAIWLSTDSVRQEQWSTLTGLLRTSQLTAPSTRVVEKRLSRAYTKGIVDETGRVSPFVLADSQDPVG